MTTEKDYDNNVVKSFEDLNLKDNLLRGIYGYGYETAYNSAKAIAPLLMVMM